MNTLPSKYKSIILPAYNDNLIRAIVGIKVEEIPIPKPGPNEVLVKMEATPINPSDIAFIRGGYNIQKNQPATPGFEGAGTVIDTGDDVRGMLGEKVSCFTQDQNSGTWAEYFIADVRDCIVLKDKINIEQAACLSVNPLTAYGMFELVWKYGCKAIVQNAAGGQVAEFIRVLAKKAGIKVINIVRKEEHIEKLEKAGSELTLCSTSENFKEKFHELSHNLNATIAFDAVGGEQTGILINNMPEDSRVIIYGGLSGQDCTGIDTLDIIFKRKVIEGFNLNEWIKMKERDELKQITDKLQDMIIAGEMKTEIQATFGLDEVASGIRSYIKSMSGGKILFKP